MATRAHNIGKREDLPAWRDPYKLAVMAPDTYSAAHADLVYGVHGYHTNELTMIQDPPANPGDPPPIPRPASSLYAALEHAIGETKGNWDVDQLAKFGRYLVARRSVQLWDRYRRRKLARPPDALSPTANKNTVRYYEGLNPTWAKAAEMVYEYNRALWDKERDSGRITPEMHRLGVEMNPDHVPFARDMRPQGRDGGRGAGQAGSLRYAGGAHRIGASFADIINPIQTIMERTHALHQFIVQNDINRALFALADSAGPGSADILSRVPTTTPTPVHVDVLEAFKQAAIAAGANPQDVADLGDDIDTLLSGETTATLWRHAEASERGEPIIYAWVNGEKIAGKLSDPEYAGQLRDILSGMNKEVKNLFVELLRPMSNLARAGVVTNPKFMLANYIRGEIADWLNSQVGFIPFVSGFFGGKAEITQSDVVRRYAAARGIVGGTVVASADKARVEKDINALNRRAVQLRRLTTKRGRQHTLELTETANRLGLFMAASRYFQKKQGMTPWQADQEASFVARDARDYARHGASMYTLSKVANYLTASLAGLEKHLRTFTGDYNLHNLIAEGMGLKKQPPVTGLGKPTPPFKYTPNEKRALIQAGKAYSFLVAAGLAGGAVAMLYAKNRSYREVGPEIRGSHWVIPMPDGKVFLIPKPFEGAVISDIIERAMEYAGSHNPEIGSYLLEDLRRWVMPPIEIPGLELLKEKLTNRDERGNPIIPDSKVGLDPQYQTNSYTSYLAKVMGKAWHMAPAELDVLGAGLFGSWGQDIEQASNWFDPDRAKRAATPEDFWVSQRFVKDTYRGALSTRRFWDDMSTGQGKLAREKATVERLRSDGDDADMANYIDHLDDPADKLFVQSALLPGNLGQFHPMNRAAKVVAQIGDMRRDLAAGKLTTLHGERIKLTPQQQVGVDRALERYAVGEMSNALTLTGRSGWADRPLTPYQELRDEVWNVSPAVARTLQQRLAMSRVVLGEKNTAVWAGLAPKITAAYQRAVPGRLAEAGRMRSPQGLMRQVEINAAERNAPEAPDEAPPLAPIAEPSEAEDAEP
jgi:hypothetical protein